MATYYALPDKYPASGAVGCAFEPRRAQFDFGLNQRVDPAEQIFFARHAGHLIAQLSVFEEE
jgi:hypothetical protein